MVIHTWFVFKTVRAQLKWKAAIGDKIGKINYTDFRRILNANLWNLDCFVQQQRALEIIVQGGRFVKWWFRKRYVLATCTLEGPDHCIRWALLCVVAGASQIFLAWRWEGWAIDHCNISTNYVVRTWVVMVTLNRNEDSMLETLQRQDLFRGKLDVAFKRKWEIEFTLRSLTYTVGAEMLSVSKLSGRVSGRFARQCGKFGVRRVTFESRTEPLGDTSKARI